MLFLFLYILFKERIYGIVNFYILAIKTKRNVTNFK